jgi:hypothetical protein
MSLSSTTNGMFISLVIYEYGVTLWNDIDREKQKNSKNLSQCHFVRHKSHIN